MKIITETARLFPKPYLTILRKNIKDAARFSKTERRDFLHTAGDAPSCPADPAPRDTGALQKFCAADDASYRRRWDLWNVEITPAAVKRKLRDTYGNSNHLYMFRKGVSDIVGLIELYEDRKGRPRISYFTLPSERGHGYAFEAYKATFNHCVKHGLVEGLFYAHTDPDNIASQHFLRSAGMSCSGSKTIKSPCSKKSCDVDSFSRIVTENTRIRHKIHIP